MQVIDVVPNAPAPLPDPLEYDHDEMEDLIQWLTTRSWIENRPSHVAAERMDGKACDIMVLYMLTGIRMDHTVYTEQALIPIMNLYNAAAPWIQEQLEPLVAKWRAQGYKDPDFINKEVKGTPICADYGESMDDFYYC